MENKFNKKSPKPSVSGFKKKDSSTQSINVFQQNKKLMSKKDLSPQKAFSSGEESAFCAVLENVSPKTTFSSLLHHFRRFDSGVIIGKWKKRSQDSTALVSFSTKEKMGAVFSITHAVDCRLLKLTDRNKASPSKRPLDTPTKDESPSKKMRLTSTQGVQLCVERLGPNTSQQTVAEYFKHFGKVLDVTMKKKVALLTFAKENSAKAVLRQKKHKINGVYVMVRLADGSKEGGDVNGAGSSAVDSDDDDEEEEESSEEDSDESSGLNAANLLQQQRIKKLAATGHEDDSNDDDDSDDDEDSDADDDNEAPQQRMRKIPVADDSDDDEDSDDDDDNEAPQQKIRNIPVADDSDDDGDSDDDDEPPQQKIRNIPLADDSDDEDSEDESD